MTFRLSHTEVFDTLDPIASFVYEFVRFMRAEGESYSRQAVYNQMIIPDGWTYLGSGCFRDVFLGPDGWVYKVGDVSSNITEVRNSKSFMLESDSSIRFPYAEDVWDYEIIRCEYVEGTILDDMLPFWEDVKGITRYVRQLTNETVYDVHEFNIVVLPDGTPAMIDLG